VPRVQKPTTRARRKREAELRRRAVLDAAGEVFTSDGYHATTTEKIARHAGVSVGTVYNLFGNRDRVYAAVVRDVAQGMLKHLKESLLPQPDAEAALEALIRWRLAEFRRHRLLLVLFSCEQAPGAYPDPDALSHDVRSLYLRYLDMVAGILDRGIEQGAGERLQPLHLALSFEGVLSAFVGYWMPPGRARDVARQVRNVKETFMRMAGLGPTRPVPDARRRAVYITSFDLARVRELAAVARSFGGAESAAYLDELEGELAAARVVDPRAVPPDVVTMNSRVRLVGTASGRSTVRRLVFPTEEDDAPENLSVLQPLGTGLLGRRVGDTVRADGSDEERRYEIAGLLYQPESAGDYHR